MMLSNNKNKSTSKPPSVTSTSRQKVLNNTKAVVGLNTPAYKAKVANKGAVGANRSTTTDAV